MRSHTDIEADTDTPVVAGHIRKLAAASVAASVAVQAVAECTAPAVAAAANTPEQQESSVSSTGDESRQDEQLVL
ncbi:MAG: hypothetical protein JKX70_10235, partial [Phycisphaerales bacterium]|nr:hypothetical protein [Phycisphaerales bacterium]